MSAEDLQQPINFPVLLKLERNTLDNWLREARINAFVQYRIRTRFTDSEDNETIVC